MSDWTKSSWQNFPIKQMPEYKDKVTLNRVKEQLSEFPSLIFAQECRDLRYNIAQAAEGKSFILQAGSCAESFSDFSAKSVRDQFRVIIMMATIISWELGIPVTKIGRIAGQFAKPRSSPMETLQNGKQVPVYRGDIINGFDAMDREPNPERMIRAYFQSAATLNALRSFSQGGYASPERIKKWMLPFVNDSDTLKKYNKIAEEVSRALLYSTGGTKSTEFWTSHEALLLDYEEPLTRVDSTTGQTYGCSGHMLWVGDRTRDLDGAHIEYLRGIKNPVGIKCGPSLDPDELVKLVKRLNPENEFGKIVLISRLGDKISDILPQFLVKTAGLRVTWICDPMHGNTYSTSEGIKTRSLKDISKELFAFFDICKQVGTVAGGIHLELTGDNVTECTSDYLLESSLSTNYKSLCDPRLNAEQSLDLAFSLMKKLKHEKDQKNPGI